MNAWPVIVREFRVESRRPFTYWLRVLGGAALLVAFGAAAWRCSPVGLERFYAAFGGSPDWVSSLNPVTTFGGVLFGNVNAALFVAIWVLVPLISADAISRERREGTLGLLFLTPLEPAGLVVGTSFSHILRALSLFLTMIPWLTVPVLVGGVGVNDVVLALLIDTGALGLALAAGLLASSFTRDQIHALLWAEVLSFAGAVWFMSLQERAWESASAVGASGGLPPGTGGWFGFARRSSSWHEGPLTYLSEIFGLATNCGLRFDAQWFFSQMPGASPTITFATQTTWGGFWTNMPASAHRARLAGAGSAMILSWVCLLGAVLLAAWQVRRSWRDEPPSVRQLRVERALFAPRFWTALFRRKMRRRLERNPIGWLQQYSPRARLIKWGWCGFILLAQIVLTADIDDLYLGQSWLGTLLLLGLSFSAAGSFRHERKSGALELLLVTPLRVDQVISGRVRGLWAQFLPSLCLLGLAGLILHHPAFMRQRESALILPFACLAAGFLSVPIIALLLALPDSLARGLALHLRLGPAGAGDSSVLSRAE